MATRSMVEGTPWKHIVRFALPLLAGSFLQQLYNTVDAVVVGQFAGEASLSAVGTTGSLAFFFLALAIGFSAGNGVVIAQHFGAGNNDAVRTAASTGILLMLGLGVVSAILSVLLARPAFRDIMSVPDDYLSLTLTYFRIFAIGLVFQYAYNIYASILRAVGDSASTLYFLLISSVLNIALDLLFVAVFRWDVAGAAAATVISQAASVFAAYLYTTRRYPIFRFKLREYAWNGTFAKQTMRIGTPIAMQMVIVSVGLTFIQRAVNEFGQAMTAAFTAGHRIEMYLNLPGNAFQTTLATYTGQNIGAGRMDRVKLGVRQTMVISLAMTFTISAAVYLLAEPISLLFGLGGQAEAYCLEYLRAVALINIILGLYVPLFGVFQGANHSAAPMVTATGALTTRVLVTYLFRYSDFLGYRIIWFNGLFGFGAGCLITWTYYASGRWQRNASLTKSVGEEALTESEA